MNGRDILRSLRDAVVLVFCALGLILCAFVLSVVCGGCDRDHSASCRTDCLDLVEAREELLYSLFDPQSGVFPQDDPFEVGRASHRIDLILKRTFVDCPDSGGLFDPAHSSNGDPEARR